MCVVSNTFDSWRDRIPDIQPWEVKPFTPYVPSKTTDSFDWKKLFDDFRKGVEAARKQDVAEGNPDCADPDKAKLEERVRELEALLNSKPEFVIVKRQNLQPGKYRVLDNKLYRVLE